MGKSLRTHHDIRGAVARAASTVAAVAVRMSKHHKHVRQMVYQVRSLEKFEATPLVVDGRLDDEVYASTPSILKSSFGSPAFGKVSAGNAPWYAMLWIVKTLRRDLKNGSSLYNVFM